MMKAQVGNKIWSLTLALCVGATLFCGCGEGSDDGVTEANDVGTPVESLFIIPTEIYGADFSSSTSYIPTVESLSAEHISLDEAREVDGRATVATVGKWLFLASTNEPTLHRYEVLEDGTLLEAGSLSFLNYAIDYFALDAWGNTIISPTKAYMFNSTDGSHVIWNPTEMLIEGKVDGPGVVKRGYKLQSSPPVIRGDRLYRTFSYGNYFTWDFPAEPQYLAVYDVESNTLISLEEDNRCPQLYGRPFLDESENIYFSGSVWTVTETLVNDYPKNCALRILAGEDSFDPNWTLPYADEITEGREAGILRYLGDGKALLDVFHHEEVVIDDSTSSSELAATPYWRLWSIDLNGGTGAPMENLGYKAPGYQDALVGGRTLILLPNEDLSETTAYEIIDGAVVPTFKIEGYSYHMAQLK